jgi:hypothetical protein
MKGLNTVRPTLAVGALLLVGAAQAARPLATDDASVLERGECELEAVVGRERAEGASVQGRALQIGCGIGRHAQLSLAGERAGADGQRERGAVLAAKTAWATGDHSGWGLSAGIAWARPSGEGTRHAASAVSLLHTRGLGDSVILHANLGHSRDEQQGRGSTAWGVALEHAGWAGMAPMAELIGDDREAPAWNLGLRWSVLPESLTLDLAYGRRIVGGRPSSLSVGATLAF